MAKNKKKTSQGGGQQFLSPEKYLRERARTLPIGKCYINEDADDAGEANIIVTRKHTGGRVSMANYLVDMLCLGVKDTFYHLRLEEFELEEYLNQYPGFFKECSYEEAHNRIYGSIAFAEEGGIEPHKDFRLTQYMLEEDTDDVPLMEFEYGRNGKHFLVCHSNLEASRYLPTLRKHLGDNFDYAIGDDDTFEDDDYNDAPVYLADCLKDFDAEELQSAAFSLGIEMDWKASLEEQRKQYVKGILEDPKDVLMRLPHEDLAMLEDLATASEEDRIVWYPDTSVEPMMYHCGLIEYDDEEQGGIYYRVAEDFWKAARPHLKEVEAEEANLARLSVEGIIAGLVNLFGVVSLKDTKSYLAQITNMPEEAATELFNIVFSHSILLPHMLHKMADGKDFKEDTYDVNMAFCSRFGWDSAPELLKAIARRDDKIHTRKEFTMEEIIDASAVIPIIPNGQKEEFIRFLRSQLGYDEDEADLICHNMWLHAQHEEDPNNPYGSYLDYFTKEVIMDARKKPQLSTVNEGMKALQTFMNAMPRWILKCFAPKEIK